MVVGALLGAAAPGHRRARRTPSATSPCTPISSSGSNQDLARSVERLEAFAEIARAVGGETDLERVLSLILDHGREIVAARDAGRLPTRRRRAGGRERQRATLGRRSRGCRSTARSPARCCSPGGPRRVGPETDRAQLEQLAPDAAEAILVPLVFRGETLGVLAAINGADERRSTTRTSSC